MEEKQDLGRLERKLHADMQSSGLFELTLGLIASQLLLGGSGCPIGPTLSRAFYR